MDGAEAEAAQRPGRVDGHDQPGAEQHRPDEHDAALRAGALDDPVAGHAQQPGQAAHDQAEDQHVAAPRRRPRPGCRATEPRTAGITTQRSSERVEPPGRAGGRAAGLGAGDLGVARAAHASYNYALARLQPVPRATHPDHALRARIRPHRPQRELRGRQGAVPRAAAGDPLRAPGDAGRAGHRLRAPTRARSATRSTAICRDTRPPRALRRHLRGPVLLRRAPDRRARRRRRRPPAHRAQPQRHRHDDVPDAAARASSSTCSTATLELRGDARSASPRRTARRCSRRTRTRSRRSRRRSRTTCWRHRAARARRRCGCGAAFATHQPIPLGACAITGTGFPIDRERTSDAARLRRADRQHLRQHRHGRLPARERVGRVGDARRRSAASSRTCCSGARRSSATCGSATASCRSSSIMPQKRNPVALEHARVDRQQGARPGAGDHAERAQHAVRRHRRHRGRPAAARRIDVPRRHARGDAGRRGAARRATSTSREMARARRPRAAPR